MGIRTISRELRVSAALEALQGARSRSRRIQATLLERQRWDRRGGHGYDSTRPATALAVVGALSGQDGIAEAAAAAGIPGIEKGYYNHKDGPLG